MTNSKFINHLRWFLIVLPWLLSACAIKPQLFTQTPAEMKRQTVGELTQDEQSSGASFKVDELHPISLVKSHNELSSQTAAPTDSKKADPTSDNKSTDLWQRLRQGFRLPASLNQSKVQVYLTWYQQHSYLQRIRSRAEPFLHFILEEVERRGMPTELALLPAVESAFRPSAYSRNGAAGLWQFTPETGRLYDLKQNWWYDGRLDIYASTHAALSYLTKLNRYFKGDWLLTLAAYNAGPQRILKAITQNRRQGKPTFFWALRLPKETRDYVPKLLALKALVETPQKVGIILPTIANKPVIASLKMDTQIDLGLAAKLAGVEIEEMARLNPGFKRWATDPVEPYRLFVPIDSLMDFKRRLAELPIDQRLTWLRHNIKRGDTLSSIASQYQTTVIFLQKANKLQTDRITADNYLLVPLAANSRNGYTFFKSDQRAKAYSTPDEIRLTRPSIKAEKSLLGISRRHTVTMKKLARLNGTEVDDTVRAGEVPIILQQRGTTNSQTTLVPEQKTAPAQGMKVIRYSVKKGDTLHRIAKRFRVHVTDLQRWNDLLHNQLLFPDQAITVHVEQDLFKQQQLMAN